MKMWRAKYISRRKEKKRNEFKEGRGGQDEFNDRITFLNFLSFKLAICAACRQQLCVYFFKKI